MRVRVLFFGLLKDMTGRSEDTLEIPESSTVASIFAAYTQRFETLAACRPSILFARNKEFVTADTAVAENDEIAFLPPVSGGSDQPSPESQLIALTRTRIDEEALSAAVKRPDDGAVVVFSGVVRNNTKGRPTLRLEYECYEDMALLQMKRIATELAAAHSIGRIGVIHRLGSLEIGEASVVIAVSAPHRQAAFDAALAAINRLKKEVPIWKKEFFADGAVWVDGEWDDALLATARP